MMDQTLLETCPVCDRKGNCPVCGHEIPLLISEFIAIRENAYRRNDFLEALSKKNRPLIAEISRRMAGIRATEDWIRNEAIQAFLISANYAIDTARLTDDGRGKNNPASWCKWKGIRGLQDFIRREFHLRSRFPREVIYTADLYDSYHADDDYKQGLIGKAFNDPVNYEEKALSHISVTAFVEKLSHEDRSIVELLAYGRANGENIVFSDWCPVCDHTASCPVCSYRAGRRKITRPYADIAETVGKKREEVENRVRVLRQMLEDRYAKHE